MCTFFSSKAESMSTEGKKGCLKCWHVLKSLGCVLYHPLLQASTKGKSKIKEVHASPGRSLGTTNVAQTDAGLYIKDKISQTKNL